MDNENPLYRERPVSFVRRGSRLQGRRQQLWDDYADRFVIDVPRDVGATSIDPGFRLDPEQTFGRDAPLVIEIGTGLGEAIAAGAAAHPEKNFLGIEVYRPGIASLLGHAAQANVSNVRAVLANAPDVLETMLPASSVAEAWMFFPDPWHKKRHHKRRLVQPYFVDLVARVLRPGGTWRLATDWQEYAEHMLDVTDASEHFTNPNDGYAQRFDGRTLTSFEKKAGQAGRAIFDIELTRR
ncbi:tRNA (guanosine(46)-N7)-methyltransferase TrmB [uncultured Agrococcus sp.]|uniref:tRNA (guanosine(46)-N7)-methyltransferase TrmB n=1 Tax=uncultured Agrococcus sp. TaxID=382258 RepID=UPI0025FAFE86|nr:tRNA (guanosine(46)-N7)-methyltransferase TrmB [uncultured Agrococcus sp.]